VWFREVGKTQVFWGVLGAQVGIGLLTSGSQETDVTEDSIRMPPSFDLSVTYAPLRRAASGAGGRTDPGRVG
jgi:hypothetical protein